MRHVQADVETTDALDNGVTGSANPFSQLHLREAAFSSDPQKSPNLLGIRPFRGLRPR